MSIKGIIGQIASRFGAIFFGLCCLGFAPLLGILSAIGASFLINDLFLIPLFIVFLGISLWGLRRGKRFHGNEKPFLLGIIFSLSALISIPFLSLLAYVSILGLVAVYVWDFCLVFKSGKSRISEHSNFP